MERVVDPEFDEQPPIQPGVCLTGRCDGSGWCSVSEAYVDRWAGPAPNLPQPETDAEAAAFAEVLHWYQCTRAAWRHSSYPCPSCRPRQFERWVGGHWDSHHDRDGCADCRRVDAEMGRRTSRRRRKEEPPPLPPEPQVVEEPEPVHFETEAML